MRLSDLPSTEVEIDIDASVERVWAVLSDLPRMGEWSPENRGGAWVGEPAGPVVGARLRARNHHPAIGEWETESLVVEAKAPRSLVWVAYGLVEGETVVGDPEKPAATWRLELEPRDGGTRVRQHVQMGAGPSKLTGVIARMPDREEAIVAGRQEEQRRNMLATLGRVKALVEDGS